MYLKVKQLRQGQPIPLLMAFVLVLGLVLGIGSAVQAEGEPLTLSLVDPSPVGEEGDPVPLAIDATSPEHAFALESWGAGGQRYRSAMRLENPSGGDGTVNDIRVKFTVAGGTCGTGPITFEYWNTHGGANTWAAIGGT